MPLRNSSVGSIHEGVKVVVRTYPRILGLGEAKVMEGKSPAIDEIRTQCKTSFLATESAAYGLSLLMLHGQDFRSAVLAAINGGGDTDTNASIVGALVGAHRGLDAIPEAWMAAIPDASQALQVADWLIEVFG